MKRLYCVAASVAAIVMAAAPASADVSATTFDFREFSAGFGVSEPIESDGSFLTYSVAGSDADLGLRDFEFMTRPAVSLSGSPRTVFFGAVPRASYGTAFYGPERPVGDVLDFSVAEETFSSDAPVGGSSVIAAVIPAPGAVVLGALGLGAVGYWAKRRMS